MKKTVFMIIFSAAGFAMGRAMSAGGINPDTWQWWGIVLSSALGMLFFPSQSLYGILDGGYFNRFKGD